MELVEEKNNHNNYHPSAHVKELTSKTMVEYGNDKVTIENAKIIDNDGLIVNLLEFQEVYEFQVDVIFGADFRHVSFGFEMKDEKGVRIATVESIKMYENGWSYNVNKEEVYRLRYKFLNLLRGGIYYLNFGVSTFEDRHIVLNRIVDLLMFKSRVNKGYSSGYVNLINKVVVVCGNKEDIVETVKWKN
jgi:hypothetical protein